MVKWIDLEDRYAAHTFSSYPVVIREGHGVWLSDRKGRRYLDLIGARSALNFGHSHPKLVKVLIDQAKKLALTSRSLYTETLGPYLKELCTLTGMHQAIPLASGTEAAEMALIAARRWGYGYKAIREGRAEIIVADDNYHGNTLSLLSLSTNDVYRKGIAPYMPGFKSIPFGSAEALEHAITKETCAFLVETMQGCAGMKIPPKGWLKKVKEICKKHEVLLILDEVQTALGRTGKNFAFQHENVEPDGLILGKSLGGGLIPSSCFLGTKELMEWFEPGSHPSTFGGSPLAAALGLEVLKMLQQQKYAKKSAMLGDYFIKQLGKIESPYLLDVRGKGLFIGLDIDPKKAVASHICEALLERGILVKEVHEMTIPLTPPLTISKKEIDWAIKRLKEVFEGGKIKGR